MPLYRISPNRSKVWIEAKSSLHPIHGEADGLEGSLEADIADGEATLGPDAQIRIELPVEKLKSGKSLEDAEMMKRIDARRFPNVKGEVREIKEQGNGRYRIRGDLTFHGVTRPVEDEVTVRVDGEKSVVIEGEHTFDIRDYGVQPPKILMLKVHPDVKVRIRVVAEPDGA